MSLDSDEMILYEGNASISGEFEFVDKFISKNPIYAALFVATLSSYLEPYLKLLGIRQKFCVVIVAPTSSGKTSRCSLLTSYGNISREYKFSSDRKDFFKNLSCFRDCPVLVEELNATESDSVRYKNEKIFSEMVQQYESGKGFVINGQSIQLCATPVVTAEYMVKNPSTINRCLIIDFPEKFVPEELSWLQAHQEYYDAFIDKFLDWICSSYEWYKDKIPNWKFRPLKVECEESYSGSLYRSRNIYKVLNMTIKLLMDFIGDTYNLPQSQMNDLRAVMKKGVDACVYSTIERLRKEDSANGEWYTNVILDYLYDNYTKVVAKDYDEYEKSQSKNKKKLFFETSDYICIAGDDIAKCFSNQREFKFVLTKKAILSQLAENGLIHSTYRNNTFTASINGKRTKNRYVQILKSEFKERVIERQLTVHDNPFAGMEFYF